MSILYISPRQNFVKKLLYAVNYIKFITPTAPLQQLRKRVIKQYRTLFRYLNRVKAAHVIDFSNKLQKKFKKFVFFALFVRLLCYNIKTAE